MRVILLASLLTPILASAQTESQPACPTLARASFTTAVENREPANTVKQVPASTAELFFYTEVHDGSNQTLYHHWSLNGDPFVDVTLEIGSDFWRTWSSKTLIGLGVKAGDTWAVSVTGAQGCDLGQWQVSLTESGQATAAPATKNDPAPVAKGKPTPAQKDTNAPGDDDTAPVDLSTNFMAIEELVNLGDTRGARSAIKRARALTGNAQQLTELDQMDKDSQAFAELNQLIRQRDIPGARRKLQELMVSVPPQSPVYPALQGRHKLLDQLNEMNRDSSALQAAATP